MPLLARNEKARLAGGLDACEDARSALVVDCASDFLLEVGRHILNVVIATRVLLGLRHDLLFVLAFNHGLAAWHQVAAPHFLRHDAPPKAEPTTHPRC